MTPEDVVARELRAEVDARVEAWKREREWLIRATARIAELDALIAFSEDEAKESFRVAPRVRTAVEPVDEEIAPARGR